jgi:hypothetical protein
MHVDTYVFFVFVLLYLLITIYNGEKNITYYRILIRSLGKREYEDTKILISSGQRDWTYRYLYLQ